MDSPQFSPLPAEHASGLADDIALSRVPKEYQGMVVQASQKYGVPVHVVSNVMKIESEGRANATSPAGARGLMQLMPGTFKDLGGQGDPYEPSQNISLGTKYLGQLLQKFEGDEQKALAAYNWGPGRVARKGISDLPPETSGYLAKYNALMAEGSPSGGAMGFAALLSKGKGPKGNLKQQMVNANQPDRDSSIGARNPMISQPVMYAVQDDFPMQDNTDTSEMPSSGRSIETILGISKLF